MFVEIELHRFTRSSFFFLCSLPFSICDVSFSVQSGRFRIVFFFSKGFTIKKREVVNLYIGRILGPSTTRGDGELRMF